MLTKSNLKLRQLAEHYHRVGFAIHESVMLAWEELEPYDSVFKSLGMVAAA